MKLSETLSGRQPADVRIAVLLWFNRWIGRTGSRGRWAGGGRIHGFPWSTGARRQGHAVAELLFVVTCAAADTDHGVAHHGQYEVVGQSLALGAKVVNFVTESHFESASSKYDRALEA